MKRCKSIGGKRFGEDVSNLITARQELNVKSFGGNHIQKKVEINFHVLSTSVENGVRR
jgi:hypothetical protein